MPCSCCFAFGDMNRSVADKVESIVAYFLERVAEEAVARWWFRYGVWAITFPYEDSVGRRFSRGDRMGFCGWGGRMGVVNDVEVSCAGRSAEVCAEFISPMYCLA